MSTRVARGSLQVDQVLADFLESRALPGTGVDAERFWAGFAELVHDFGPQNRALLDKREKIQGWIDDWHVMRRTEPMDHAAYARHVEEQHA